MERSWMKLRDHFCLEYAEGVREFMRVATQHAGSGNRVRCPCKNCKNCYFRQLLEVKRHLLLYGILEDYTCWIHHGETIQVADHNLAGEKTNNQHISDDQGDNIYNDIPELLEDLQRGTFAESFGETSTDQNTSGNEGEVEKFARLLNDANQELYPGCLKYSKLSFLLKMVHAKSMGNCSNKAFDMMLTLFKSALPEGATLPKSYYDVKKLLRDLGLGYIKIDACQNDCALFWKEHENLDRCPNLNCQAPRWKYSALKRKKIPHKVLRYFPVKARLQRLFMFKETSEDMRWHKEKRVQDGVIRHPADAIAWQEFDKEHDWFAQDPRNVRVGLASDGFNPFGNMSTTYSMWPVFLIPYNLPPWKCMKEPFIMLSLLIPGKDSPGNEIDIYLRPLVDELKELWLEGVETYDSYKDEKFRLHAILL
ncbi:uncharacterized protein LOC116207115 isoform X2 [Punica granatum]|uniref:Uncharacterized protein LOC116207115 isoform X2 n=1 Tax=Punica granatum TaxID=22663 RepID=A0A6P8DN48_PUNGR|nr:uncharacterized protein LOC116207115 isoform X2 [Punica granatum]XP_031395833.1 uncharacterized protein LOC116207115 isoform X2 [Punica granatum]XP_031395834.1 uncharacterized protein LOC116207115 isoform X2 [Punica granatum]